MNTFFRGVLSCSAAFEQRLISSKQVFNAMFAVPTSIHACVAYWPSLFRSRRQKQGEKYIFSASVCLPRKGFCRRDRGSWLKADLVLWISRTFLCPIHPVPQPLSEPWQPHLKKAFHNSTFSAVYIIEVPVSLQSHGEHPRGKADNILSLVPTAEICLSHRPAEMS